MRQNRRQAVPHVQSTLAKLSLCRTPALGEHLYQCESCDHSCIVYNSCGDRHCPQCSGAKRRTWMDSAAKLLLPGIDYFQVVFTMPDKLSSLALGNRREMFDLLFRSAWRALKQVIEDEQQFEAAASMILHLWNQHLESHVHVHAFVPGGGPSLQDPEKWVSSHPPAHETQNRFWLVDADELRLAFRTEFLKGLRSLHRRDKLKLTGEWEFLRQTAAFDVWLQPLEQKTWVTFIQA
ncbi:MAG: transposase, partial [Fuerstiella sp.]|nr:transposase [Fuerstiella sp.]